MVKHFRIISLFILQCDLSKLEKWCQYKKCFYCVLNVQETVKCKFNFSFLKVKKITHLKSKL